MAVIDRRKNRPPSHLTLERRKEVAELHAKGLNDAETGKALGLPRARVQQIRKKLGLKKNGRRRKPRPCKICGQEIVNRTKNVTLCHRVKCHEESKRRFVVSKTGEQTERTKLTMERARAIKQAYETEEFSHDELCEMFKVSGLTLSRALRLSCARLGRGCWGTKRAAEIEAREKRDAKAVEMKRAGLSWREIASRLGVTPAMVSYALRAAEERERLAKEEECGS